jgi:pSer/pThr/pTyr-binding forkhead associated (FHA) protein
VITCPACGKQNQDHYRFCLGCGAELPRGAPVDPDATLTDDRTNVSGTQTAEVAREAAALPPGMCPECEYVNPPTNRFCASCGFRLDEAPKVVAGAGYRAPPLDMGGDDAAAILVALDPEGNEIGRHRLTKGENLIGRATGGVFGSDTYLSPEHAIFHAEGRSVRVRDAGSLNGVFRKLLAEQRALLKPGQRFRIGQELLQYDPLDPHDPDKHGVAHMGGSIDGYIGRLSLVVGRESCEPSHPIADRGLSLGRERGDVLFPEDGYVSGLHCHVSYEDGEVWVTDLGSSNGTFVQLVDEAELRNGDVLLMGQQLFRVTL